jgi:hypothetical protein
MTVGIIRLVYTTRTNRALVNPLRCSLEFLEPDRQPISIRTILTPPWQLDHLPGDPLQPEFEKRAVMDFGQPVGDMNSVIGVDADQVGIEGRMVDLGQRQPIRDNRLAKLLVRVHDDVSGIEQPRLGRWEIAQRPPGAQNGIPERCLVDRGS